MRKADLRKNHSEFNLKIRGRFLFLWRMYGTIEGMTLRDKRELSEGTLLKLCSYWEEFVDSELVDCINLSSKKFAEYLGTRIPKNLSKAMCEAILFRWGYLDFKSVGELKGFSKKVLKKELNPFLLIEPATAKRIDEVFVIRNYLMHRSQKARRSLMGLYRESYGLKAFREPGTFLYANNGRRMGGYIRVLLNASEQMAGII